MRLFNSKSLTIFILLLVVLMASVTLGTATTIYVPDNYSTIQAAVDAATSGDTIIVRSGIYVENIVLGKSATLRGDNYPVVNANGGGTAIVVTADNCLIEGFRVTGSGTNWPDSGVRVEADNVIVRDTSAMNNQYGIIYSSSTGGEISGVSTSRNAQQGILLVESIGCSVHDNKATSNLEGIHVAYSQDIDIYGNTVHENSQYGIIVRESNNVQVFDNTASKNGVNGFLIGDSTSCSVYGNVVQRNGFYGMALSNTSLTSVFENDFSYNEGEAIHLSHSATRNEIRANEVAHNVTGIAIHDSSNNTIHHNVLKDNDSQAHDNSVNEWDDGAEGNCWSDYIGLDENKDRIGDTPYDIPGGNNKDRYPLMATSPGVQAPTSAGLDAFSVWLPKSLLETMYAHGSGQKFFLIAGVSTPWVELLGITAFIDLDDYFEVTNEGKEDWVTVLLTVSVGVGANLLPFDIGVYKVNLADVPGGCPDPQIEASAGLLTFTAGYKVAFAEVGPGGQISHIDMDTVEGNVGFTLAEMTTASLNVEVKREVLDQALLQALPGIGQVISAAMFTRAIVDAITSLPSIWPQVDFTLPVRGATCED